MTLLALFVVVFGFMLLESRRAAANERLQRGCGGIEPSDDVYAIMRVAYPAVFAAMIVEGVFAARPPFSAVAVGLTVFALGKALKWWAIVTLGQRWTFRVVVVPGMPLARTGPYRVFRHPNYVGVVGELVGVVLMTGAWISGTIGSIAFAGLMMARVRVENRALDAILRRS
ncbi:MAG: isoprenylcysteine carboxylmethyltransferase family protein [Vicinamibacterales bacterium]